MSQLGISGTQSPPLEDSTPLGVSSIKGDPVKGKSDLEQRAPYAEAEYFGTANSTEVKDDTQKAKPTNVFEVPWKTAPTGSGAFKEMSNEEIREAMESSRR
ncbi:hypothetical protein BV25DRAFT_1897148 [Artomyces pyxidatus]|uniref:Uncharacterized protein n=1 Tax=Artomyces pyxidatus TaxID=48021 RepID=A0ACB8TEI9_9AGAM|nr:hypothetical protein BV25DRAFT_1897148 [Artomyces pyxidatus]